MRAENVGMALDQLFADTGAHVLHGEGALFLRDTGMERHLQQHVAQLLAQMAVIALVDGFTHFISFFYEVFADGGMGLGRVPGTALSGTAQIGHDLPQVFKTIGFLV